MFSQTDLNNPQNLFLVGYDSRDGSDLFGMSEIDNSCGSTSPTLACALVSLDGGTDYLVLAIQNRGVSSVHINNIFVNEIQHSWKSTTLNQRTSASLPSQSTFSMVSSLTTKLQVAPDISSGKTGYVIVKLSTELGSLWNKKLVNIRVDEKGKIGRAHV